MTVVQTREPDAVAGGAWLSVGSDPDLEKEKPMARYRATVDTRRSQPRNRRAGVT